jgi:hypothetical protein
MKYMHTIKHRKANRIGHRKANSIGHRKAKEDWAQLA